MKLLISGYYGFGNAGDEAVLAALVQELRRRLPEAQLCVLSGAPAATRALHGVEALQRWSAREVWRSLRSCRLLIQGGGGLLQDVTSKVSPVYYLGILRLARLRRVPAMVFAQGIGPLHTPFLQRLAAAELRRTAAICVRDQASADLLARWGVRHPAPRVVADPALLLEPLVPPDRPAAPYALLTVRQWPQVEGAVVAFRALAAHLVADHGLGVCVVPFQEPADLAVCRAVADGLESVQVTEGLGHPGRYVGLVAGARLVVSLRLHGLIFAAAQAVPALGVSYDPKLDAFAARAGQPVVPLGECEASRLIAAADGLLAQADARAQERQAAARTLREAAEVSFECLEGLLQG